MLAHPHTTQQAVTAREGVVAKPAVTYLYLCIVAVVAIGQGVLQLLQNSTMIDLEVYRMGSASLRSGQDVLYSLTYVGENVALPYTYPPFSTVLFAPLSLGTANLSAQVLALITLACWARVSWLVARHLKGVTPRSLLPVALLIFFLGLLGEPGRTLLELGQIATVLTWLVVEDWLGVGSRCRFGGVFTGIATGIKLIPGIFIALSVVLGQWRKAGVAVVTMGTTVLIGVAALPESSRMFWTGVGFDATRVGGVAWAGNQSFNALAWRTFAPDTRLWWWLLMSAAVGFLWLVVVRSYYRHQDLVAVVLLTGLTALLVSPVSWTHHWVWLAPIALWLWYSSDRSAHTFLLVTGRGLAVIAVLVMVMGPVTLVPNQESRELTWTASQWFIGHSYVLLGALTMLWAFANLMFKPSPKLAVKPVTGPAFSPPE